MANSLEWNNLSQVLQVYEKALGHKLNAAKTSIFFSKNTPTAFRTSIRSSSGVSVSASFEKYLGLPALVGWSKTRTFVAIRDRVKKKLVGWKEKFLSQAGKEVLLKAVVQAIPTYSMSMFQLPKALCKSINSLMSHFWWGHKSNMGCIAWMSWKRLGISKQSSGMGFRDL